MRHNRRRSSLLSTPFFEQNIFYQIIQQNSNIKINKSGRSHKKSPLKPAEGVAVKAVLKFGSIGMGRTDNIAVFAKFGRRGA
jgi:hypothetical protein